jgi:hypothetical protein
MEYQPSVKETLNQMKDLFSSTAMECIETLFKKKPVLKDPWKVSELFNCQFERSFWIGSSNKDYQALIILGMQTPSISVMLGQDWMPSDAFDAFGEMLNIFNGMLMDKQKFIQTFGIMIQSLPVMHMEGESIFSPVCCVHGNLYIEGHPIFIGFSIKKKPEKHSS